MYLRYKTHAYLTALAGGAVSLIGATWIVMAGLKVWSERPSLNGIARFFWERFGPFSWFWDYMPGVNSRAEAYEVFLHPSTIIALIIICVGIWYVGSAIRDVELIGEAERQSRIQRYKGCSSNQSVRGVTAGGDVTIHQTIGRVGARQSSFWSGPIGVLVVTILAIVIGSFLTLWLGTTH